MAAPLDPDSTYRLEFDGASRRNPGRASCGFAVVDDATGHLVLTGCAVLPYGSTNNEAEYCGLLYGMEAARRAGARRLAVQGDSQLVLSQLDGSYKARSTRLEPLLRAARALRARFAALECRHVPRELNATADLQANLALDLAARLGAASHAPPSGYRAAALRLAALLALPPGEVLRMEGADDFRAAVAEVAAKRCGVPVADVEATMASEEAAEDGRPRGWRASGPSRRIRPDAAAAAAGGRQDAQPRGAGAEGAGGADAAAAAAGPSDAELWQAVPRPLLMFERRYSREEGLTYATMVAKQLPLERLVPLSFVPLEAVDGSAGAAASAAAAPAAAAPAAAAPAAAASAAAAAAGGGGQARLEAAGAPAGAAGHGGVVEQTGASEPAESAGVPAADVAAPGSSSSGSSSSSSSGGGGGIGGAATATTSGGLADPSDPELPADLAALLYSDADGDKGGALDPDLLTAAGPDAVRPLPPVGAAGPQAVHGGAAALAADAAATYVLQFDGASRNNPGRAAWAYVLHRGVDARSRVAHGCMTLPYGTLAVAAEYWGLVKGLEAAAAMGVKKLVVEGDAEMVIQQLLYHRSGGISRRQTAALFVRASQLVAAFDEIQLVAVPRERNHAADKLANVALDIDSVLYGLMCKDIRGRDGVESLLKAAGVFKMRERIETLVAASVLPDLLVSLAHRVMALPPEQLLERLEDKARRLGDPNPWLVQEVRAIVQSGQVHAASWAAATAVAFDGRTGAAKRDMQALRQQVERKAADALAPGLGQYREDAATARAARVSGAAGAGGGAAAGPVRRRRPMPRVGARFGTRAAAAGDGPAGSAAAAAAAGDAAVVNAAAGWHGRLRPPPLGAGWACGGLGAGWAREPCHPWGPPGACRHNSSGGVGWGWAKSGCGSGSGSGAGSCGGGGSTLLRRSDAGGQPWQDARRMQQLPAGGGSSGSGGGACAASCSAAPLERPPGGVEAAAAPPWRRMDVRLLRLVARALR